MRTCEVLRQERERRGLTQAKLAKATFLHDSTLRSYELGDRPIPADALTRVARHLRSPRLPVIHCHNCPANLFIPPFLDGVDHHPLAALSAMLEEAKEAVQAAEGLQLRNRRGPADLNPEERRRLEAALDQVLDLITVTIMTAAAWSDTYELDCWAAVSRNHAKLARKGLTRDEEAAA